MSNTPYNPADFVDVDLSPAITQRNRLTGAFRLFLAIPHIPLVGGPIAFIGSYVWGPEDHTRVEWGAGALWNLAAFYLRWRVRAVAYLTLLRDEYPPFSLS